ELISDPRAAAVIRLRQLGRIDVVFGSFAPRQLACKAQPQLRLQLLEPRARDHMHTPRLHVAAGRRARRALENVAYRGLGNRAGNEGTAGVAGSDSIAHVHVSGTSRQPNRYSGAREPAQRAVKPARRWNAGTALHGIALTLRAPSWREKEALMLKAT